MQSTEGWIAALAPDLADSPPFQVLNMLTARKLHHEDVHDDGMLSAVFLRGGCTGRSQP
jgi:hypothetical protein